MKSIIICEGKNDRLLIKEALEKIGITENIKYFCKKDCEKKDLFKHNETICIRSFFGSYSHDKILVKSEGGKHLLFDIISHLLVFIIENVKNLVVFLDTDGEEPHSIFEEFKKIEKRRGGSVFFREESIKTSSAISFYKL